MANGLSRRDWLKYMGISTGVALTGVYLSGCSSGSTPSAPATPTPGGSGAKPPSPFRFAYKSDIMSLNPNLHTDTTSNVIQSQWLERLVVMGRDGKYKGVLAESWEFVDGQNLRMKLRRDVKFHNGETFDAEALRVSLQYIQDPANKANAAPLFASLQELTVEDPYTVVFRTKAPDAAVMAMIGSLWPVPPKHVQAVGWAELAKKPIGTGAFKFAEWSKDVQVVAEPFAEYWGGAPKLGKITYRPIPEDSSRLAALLNKEIDFMAAVPIDRVAEVRKNPALKVATRPGQLIYLAFDTLNFAPFKRKLVRQAFNYAVNAEALTRDLMLGMAPRLNGPLHVQGPGYDQSLAPFPYDPEKAKALLAQAGFPNGFAFRLDVAPGFQGAQKLKEVAESIQADLAKVGVTANLNLLEPAEAFNLYAARKLQAYLFAWGSSPETGRHVYTLLHSKTRGYYYQNPDADKVLDKYMQTVDPTARIAAGKEMVAFFRDDCPWVYLYQEPDIFGMEQSLNWEANLYDYIPVFAEMSRA